MSKPEVTICMGSSCFARGNEKNLQVIQDYLETNNLVDEVDLVLGCALCQNCCGEGPNVMIDGKLYGNVDPQVMLLLLKKLFENKG